MVLLYRVHLSRAPVLSDFELESGFSKDLAEVELMALPLKHSPAEDLVS